MVFLLGNIMNVGKRFEKNFKDSVPKNIFVYRFKDGSAAWDNGSKTRFQATNICDFMLYKKPYIFLLELKSTKGKSLPFSNVKEHQRKELLEASKHDGVFCGLLIEFSSLNTVYFIEISQFERFLLQMSRKSLPLEYVSKNGVKIDLERKRINYKMNIEKMIEDIVNG